MTKAWKALATAIYRVIWWVFARARESRLDLALQQLVSLTTEMRVVNGGYDDTADMLVIKYNRFPDPHIDAAAIDLAQRLGYEISCRSFNNGRMLVFAAKGGADDKKNGDSGSV